MEEGRDPYRWKKPLCLLENISGQEMQLKEETIKKLREINNPLVVVAIVGLYRTGKSYLMNKLAGQQSGFDLGNTVQAHTKGIWIWCIPHPVKRDTCLALLDTEGLGDVEKGDSENDVMLFSLAALLCGTLVYNSKGTIDQTAMNNIHFVTRISERLKITEKSETCEDDDLQLAEFFPSFIWAVRDFNLELVQDGKRITPDEYLETALKLKGGASAKSTEYNLPRRCIRRYFKERKCFVFPMPVTDQMKMLKLEKVAEKELCRSFVDGTNEFSSYIYNHSSVKMLKGHALNGPKFAGLAMQFVDQINRGTLPTVESAVVSMARRVNQDALEMCSNEYREAMKKLEIPCNDENILDQHHKQCEKTVRLVFMKLSMIIDDDKEIVEQFTKMIENSYKEICKENDDLLAKKWRKKINELMKDIQTKVDAGTYYIRGGYTKYQTNFAEIVKQYLALAGRGTQSSIVLEEMLKKQTTTAKSIMSVDKNVTEAQQKEEEHRLEQEQLKNEMLQLQKANERAQLRLEEHSRLQKEFMQSMETKFNEELNTYKKEISQLKEQLGNERRRLNDEGQIEDAAEFDDYLTRLGSQQTMLRQSSLSHPIIRFWRR